MNAKRIGIIGSGTVGQALGKGFVKAGYEVMIGTRDPGKLKDWQKEAGPDSQVGSVAQAAKFGAMLVFCPKWEGAEQAINMAGKEHFNGKIVIDTTNPLVMKETGKPPTLGMGFPNSAGKTLQGWLPKAHVVKCFNIVTAAYMANPTMSEGSPDMFLAGNNADAKKEVSAIAQHWGWATHDLGDIDQSYLLESLAMIWIRWGFLNNHWTHAFKLLKK